jgi:hypothetical protein
MATSKPWIATLAEICGENDETVATIRAIYRDGQLTIEPQIENAGGSISKRAVEVLRKGTIKLWPNEMLRYAEPGSSETADLGEFIETESHGRLRLRKHAAGIEEGLAMKQRVWAQDREFVPFSELVKRMKASLAARQQKAPRADTAD